MSKESWSVWSLIVTQIITILIYISTFVGKQKIVKQDRYVARLERARTALIQITVNHTFLIACRKKGFDLSAPRLVHYARLSSALAELWGEVTAIGDAKLEQLVKGGCKLTPLEIQEFLSDEIRYRDYAMSIHTRIAELLMLQKGWG